MEGGDDDRVKEGQPNPGTGQERPEGSTTEAKRQRQMIEEV